MPDEEEQVTRRPNRPKPGSIKAAAACAGAGAAAGGVTAASVGGMGLAVGGTAVSIGAAPVVAAGAVLGLAAYGMYRLFR
jgi:hypothetical protein